MSHSRPSKTAQTAKTGSAPQASEKKDDQSSADFDDGKCIRCWSATATVSTDHMGRDMGEVRYCTRCHEVMTARALKDWRLVR